jgi:hypothetical protein
MVYNENSSTDPSLTKQIKAGDSEIVRGWVYGRNGQEKEI